jgi:predicted DNA-binding antitoxin AbrB/MazE fold protein
MYMRIKAVYKNEVLKPLKKLGLKEGDVIEIGVPISAVDNTYAASKLSSEKIDEIIESTESGG